MICVFFFCYSEFRKLGENNVEARAGVHTRRVVRMELGKSVRRDCPGQLRWSSRSHHQLQTGSVR